MVNKVKKLAYTAAAAIACSVVLAVPALADTVGLAVSPPSLDYDQFLRGQVYEEEFTIMRPDTADDEVARITVETDDDVATWMKFTPGVEIPFPDGEDTVTVTLEITVPNDAEYKDYESSFTIQNLPPDEDGDGVTVVPGVLVNTNFTVTEKEIEDWEIRDAEIADFAMGDPMVVMLNIYNMGNVEAVPSKVMVEVRKNDGTVVATYETTSIPGVAAYKQGDVDVTINNVDLEEGYYQSTVSVYEDGEVVYEEEEKFNVLEEGATVAKDGEEETEGTPLMTYLLIGGALLGVGAVVLVVALTAVGKKKEDEPAKA
jgi:hypothetical protein